MRITFMRLPGVLSELGLSKSTLYDRVDKGLWPKPVSLGPRAVGWPAHEVTALISAMLAGQSDNDVRALVKSLAKARETASTAL